ncbi:MAG: hypothetical protein M5R36_02400 [Deltaproteobacteria bacterium]|nr:hypothetical protein [Deltaproteobacteria bacterium]
MLMRTSVSHQLSETYGGASACQPSLSRRKIKPLPRDQSAPTTKAVLLLASAPRSSQSPLKDGTFSSTHASSFWISATPAPRAASRPTNRNSPQSIFAAPTSVHDDEKNIRRRVAPLVVLEFIHAAAERENAAAGFVAAASAAPAAVSPGGRVVVIVVVSAPEL